MATTRAPLRGGTVTRPPVILLVSEPDDPPRALEEALRGTGAVLVSCDPDAAPGFLETSEWPGVSVTVPDLILTVGPRAGALPDPSPSLIRLPEGPTGSELTELLIRVRQLLGLPSELHHR